MSKMGENSLTKKSDAIWDTCEEWYKAIEYLKFN